MEEIFNRPIIKGSFLIVLIAIGLNFGYAGIWESFSRIGIDFDAYYYWDKYLGKDSEKQIGIYPPSWWLVMLPFRILPYPLAKNLWVLLNLLTVFAIFGGTILWIKQEHLWDKALYFWLNGFLLIGILYFYPLIVTLQTGQVNLLLLFLLILSFWYYLQNKKTVAAILLGIAMAMKALPIIVLLYWLLKKEYKITLIAIGTVFIFWLFTIPIFGLHKQALYFTSLMQVTQSPYAHWQQLNNTSLYAFWSQTEQYILQNPVGLGKILFSISIILLLSVWVYTVSRTQQQNRCRLTLEYAWSVGTLPLLLNFTEMHHFILSLLIYLVAIGLWFRIKNPMAKIGLVISWILVNLGFQIGDVTTLSQSSYLYRYLSLFGILIGWISGLLILYP